MKRFALYFVYLTCMLCNCKAQTAPSPAKDMTRQYMYENQLVDSKGYRNMPAYRVISVENTYTLRWTDKTFTGVHKNKANLWLISAVVKGMNTKWLNRSLSIATKDVWVLKDSIQKDVITIVALKSAETGWNINTFNREYFMIDECKASLYAVPYFINGSVYVICIIPSFQIVGNEVRPVIDRKILYEDILKPLMNKVFL